MEEALLSGRVNLPTASTAAPSDLLFPEQLPERRQELVRVEFGPSEWEFYRGVEQEAKQQMRVRGALPLPALVQLLVAGAAAVAGGKRLSFMSTAAPINTDLLMIHHRTRSA